MINTAKCKIAYFSPERILNFMTKGILEVDGIKCVQTTNFPTLPNDYWVKSVFFDPNKNAFGFIIQSESFDPIEIGHEYPNIQLSFDYVDLAIIGFMRDS